MATFTITTAVNIDTLVGRTGGDTFNINGGTLTIDEDSRYGVNANTSAIVGTITPSASLGGSIFIDGRSIWLIPFTGGSGTVPACNTTISKGGASGLLLGVYSALNVAPTAAGGAMPATGYIKVKQWNGILYGTGALTGITATAATGETVGWIEPCGQEGTLCLLSSLNQTTNGGYFSRGDWYTIGTTSGSRATTYQIPTNGVDVYHGGVMVDKAAATTITNATWSSGTATITSTAHGLSTGDRVFIGVDILPRTWRTVDTVTITVVDANTFTYSLASNPGTYTSGGKVAAQEWWPITNSANTKFATDNYRGKVAWLDQTTGLLRFGNDGTTSTGGALPASGLVIRIPNIMTSNATSAAKTVNSLNAAVASRWRWYNGALGIAKSTHLSGTWSPSVFQTGKQVIMSDSAHHGQISIQTQLGECSLTNVCVGGNGTTTATSALTTSSLFANNTYIDCVFNGNDIGTNHFVLSMTSTYYSTFTRCKFFVTGDRSGGVHAVNLSICRNLTFTNCSVGGNGITASQASYVTWTNTTMWGASYGRTPPGNPTSTIRLQNLSQNWTIDTVTFPTAAGSGTQRTSFLDISGSSDNFVMRNIGTRSAPVDMRLNGYQDAKSWTRVTTTATVTEVGHPYSVNDQVVVYTVSDTSAITRTVKTITAVTANTFDFACTNAGAASGTISYYVAGIASGLILNGSSNIKIQNVHILGMYSTLLSHSTSNFGVVLQDITLEPRAYNLTPLWGSNNLVANSISLPDYSVQANTAVSGVQGAHFMDAFQREPSVPGQSAAVTGVSWARSGSTITVTSTAHGLMGGIQRIWVENSSSEAAVANGWGASGVTLNVIDANTFTFTGTAGGISPGTLDYKLFGDSLFQCKMSEPSASTTSQAQITVNGGAAGFTGAGTLVLPAVGDQATWETPSYITAFTGFGLTPAIPYGSGITSLANTQQFDIEYQLNTGSGFGSWRNAAYYRTRSSGGTSGTNTLTLTAIGNVAVGDYIMGVGVPGGTKVTSIATNTVTLNNNFTANASGVYTFWYMPNESSFPSTGIKLKVRVTTNTANTATFYEVDFPMLSNSTTRGYLYSQLDQYTLTLTGLQSGSDISIRTAGVVGTALVNVDANAGTTYAYTYYYVAGTYIDIDVYKAGYKVAEVKNYLLTAANVNYPITQTADLEYA